MKHENTIRIIPAPFEFRARLYLFPFLFFIFVASTLLLPTSSFAQGHFVTLSSTSPIQVSPDTINFGNVRVGSQRDSSYVIVNNGTSVTLDSLYFSISQTGTEFTVDSFHTKSRVLNNGSSPPDTVYFLPQHIGSDTGIITISWMTDSGYTKPTLVLIGTGVGPNVISSGTNFGNWRVDSASPTYTIAIVNNGSDTTAINSVTIVDSSEIKDSDFQVSLDSLPPSGAKPIRIGYEGGDSALSFTVQFQPRSLGMKTIVIRIHTVDGESVYDTIRGTGVEPLVLVNPSVIDLGTIMVQRNGSQDSTIDTSFFVSNAMGMYPAILDTLTYHDSAGNFTVQLDQPVTSHEMLAAGGTVTGTVIFTITAVGDFTDTVYIPNDTRYGLYASDSGYKSDSNYQPMIILKAKVRTGLIGPFTASLDTITNCDTVSDTVAITNPYPVEVYIDSIQLLSDTAGFSYRQNSFLHTISIPPDSSYPVYLDYAFPPDSVNGPQALKMLLFHPNLDGEQPVVDTVTANLFRKEQLMTLAAHLPPAGSVGTSAGDIAELRVPITLEGPRSGVTELNSWTLSLQFSNDLFTPTGIDNTGSLSIAGDPSYTLTPNWDQSTRTYTIVATGTAVSDPANIANNLLITILMQAYVTTDTVVTVTPTFTWFTRPCAYALQSFMLSIPYANDCGDQTIREIMEGETPSFILTGAWPNPATQSSGVSIGYRAAEVSEVTTTVFSEAGEELGHFETPVSAGAGTIALPEGLIPSSGSAFIRIGAVDQNGAISAVQTCKIAVMK